MCYTRSDIQTIIYGLYYEAAVLFRLTNPSDNGWFRPESTEKNGTVYYWESMAAREEPEIFQILRRAAEESNKLSDEHSGSEDEWWQSLTGRVAYTGSQDELENLIVAMLQRGTKVCHQCTVLRELRYHETKICIVRLFFKGMITFDWRTSKVSRVMAVNDDNVIKP